MKVYSYVIVRDFGFAPNPFHGLCTLATCKPNIRAGAQVGDWVVATGSKSKGLAGKLVYAMQVAEALTFDAYWSDPRFACKRPVLNGSLKQLYGDNIYHRGKRGWVQADSHHSLEGGEPNPINIEHDTKTDRVLVGQRFVYFGGKPVPLPTRLRRLPGTGEDLCCPGRNHRVAGEEMVHELDAWLDDQDRWGLQDLPAAFARARRAIDPTKRRRASGA